jgi:hypothetical protein
MDKMNEMDKMNDETIEELKLNTWEIMRRWYDLLKDLPTDKREKICNYITSEIEDFLYEYDKNEEYLNENNYYSYYDPDEQSGNID